MKLRWINVSLVKVALNLWGVVGAFFVTLLCPGSAWAWEMPWGGVVEVTPLAITGYAMFDWFFTVMIIFGIVAWMIGAVINVLTRS